MLSKNEKYTTIDEATVKIKSQNCGKSSLHVINSKNADFIWIAGSNSYRKTNTHNFLYADSDSLFLQQQNDYTLSKVYSFVNEIYFFRVTLLILSLADGSI